MISKEVQDKLSEVNTELQNKYLERTNVYMQLALLEEDIKSLEDTKNRLASASASLGGIDEKSLDAVRNRLAP